jgi:ABC-type phosphate transport system substrate-binding protein
MQTSALIALILAVFTGTNVQADEIVAITNLAATPISKQQIVDLFLGRVSGWTPIDQAEDSGIYVDFYKKATGRDTAQVKAIWSRIVFTGRGRPPKQLPDSAAVKKAIAANPNAVGYIKKSAVDASVKVVLALN